MRIAETRVDKKVPDNELCFSDSDDYDTDDSVSKTNTNFITNKLLSLTTKKRILDES